MKKGIICGVGINDADYRVTTYVVISVDKNGVKKKSLTCPIYATWARMIHRCYSEKYQKKAKAYIGCNVCDEWLYFSNFKIWMISQDWQGKHLDKDIIVNGNKKYAPDKCAFVSQKVNSFVIDCRNDWRRGNGNESYAGIRKFDSRCSNPFTGKHEHLGYFTSIEASREAWRARKHELACLLADEQQDPRVAAALRTRYTSDPRMVGK